MTETFTKDGLRYYRDPTQGGALVSVPQDVDPAGYLRPVSEAELRADAQREKDSSFKGIAATAGMRALSGLTSVGQALANVDPSLPYAAPGLREETMRVLKREEGILERADLTPEQRAKFVDPADTSRPMWQQLGGMLGGPTEQQLAAEERRLSQENPIAGLVGEAVGQLASTPFSPVAAARGALAKGIAAGVEGAAMSIPQMQTQARLENDPVSLGEYTAGMAIGGVLGFGVGSLLGRAGSPRAPRVVDEIAQSADVATAGETGLLSAAAKKLGQAQKTATGADEEAMNLLGIGSTHPDRDIARDVVLNPARAAERDTREFTEALTEWKKGSDSLHKLWGTDFIKRDVVEDLISSSNVSNANALKSSSMVAQQVSNMAKSAAADAQSYITQNPSFTNAEAALKPIIKRVLAFSDDADSVAASIRKGEVTASDANVALDRLKRQIYRYLEREMPSAASNEAKHGGYVAVAEGLARSLGDMDPTVGMAGKLKTFLEDESVWGRAGRLQREVNAGVSEMMGVSEEFVQKLGTKLPNEYMSRVPRWGVNPEKTASALSLVAENPDGFLARDIAAKMSGFEKAVEAMRRLGADGIDDIETGAASVERVRKAVSEAQKHKYWNDMHQRLVTAQHGMASTGATNPAMLGVVGVYTMGPVGAPVGIAASAAFRPASMVNIAHQSRKILARLGASRVADVARNAVVAPGRAVGKAVKKAAGSAAKAAEVAGPRAAATAGALVATYREQANKVRELASDELSRLEHLQRVAPGLAYDPELAAATNERVGAALQWLASRIPSSQGRPSMFDRAEPQPPRGDMIRWMDDLRLVADPMGAIDDARRGGMSQAKIDTLKQLYPEIFRQAQLEIEAEVLNRARTDKLPYWHQNQLEKLLGLTGMAPIQLSPTVAKPSSRRGGTPAYAQQTQTPDAKWPSAQ